MCTTNNSNRKGTCSCPSCSSRNENPTILQEIFAELDYQLGAHTTGRKLSDSDKDSYRSQAIRGRNKILEWKKRCEELKKRGQQCEVHHVIPLQFAHLFRGKNPNRSENVLLLSQADHDVIHANLAEALKKAKNNEDRKRILEAFRRKTMGRRSKYINDKLPSSFKGSILKEIFEELNLID